MNNNEKITFVNEQVFVDDYDKLTKDIDENLIEIIDDSDKIEEISEKFLPDFDNNSYEAILKYCSIIEYYTDKKPLDKIFKKVRKILIKKNDEYTDNSGRYYCFSQAAKLSQSNLIDVLNYFKLKHVTWIRNFMRNFNGKRLKDTHFCNDWKTFSYYSKSYEAKQKEFMEHIIDALNYSILGYIFLKNNKND